MYEISCRMCMDLIPLVEDGVASEDSRDAVMHHVENCPVCKERYAGDTIPPGDEKKAVSRLVGRLQWMGALLLVAGIVVGIFMMEQTIQGMSAVFAVLVFFVGWMFRYAFTKSANLKGKAARVLVFGLALAAASGLVWLANVLMGNPVSQMLAQKGAEAYLQEQYPGTDYQVERVTHNFLQGEYYAVITSPTRVDGNFELNLDMMGNVVWDGYELYVASGHNTAGRINREYRNLVDPILKKLNLDTTVHIGFGDLRLDGENLMVDGEYDIALLGAQQGHLTVTILYDEVNAARASELLLQIDALMEEYGGTFYSIDLTLSNSEKTEDGRTQTQRLELTGFLRDDIYPEGLAERVENAAVMTES